MDQTKGRTPGILGACGITLAFFLINILTVIAIQLSKNYIDYNDEVIYACVQLIYQLAALMLPMILYTFTAKLDIKETFKFRSLSFLQVFILAVMGFVIMLGANYINNVFLQIITLIAGEPEIPNIFESDNALYLILISFSVVVIAPLFEELFTRGFVQSSFKSNSAVTAAVFTSLIFGLMHLTIYQLVYAFILGLFMSWAVRFTRSIWASVIIHFVCNFVSTAVSLVLKNINLEELTAVYEGTDAVEKIFYIMTWLTVGIFLISMGLLLLWALYKVSRKRSIAADTAEAAGGPAAKLHMKEKLALSFTLAAGFIMLVLALL